MSNTVPTSTTSNVRIQKFSTDEVNFIANDDLRLELRDGGNGNTGSGDDEGHVLVTINVDDCAYSNVEVSAGSSREYVDAIDAAIESLIVIRDSLRKMEAAA